MESQREAQRTWERKVEKGSPRIRPPTSQLSKGQMLGVLNSRALYQKTLLIRQIDFLPEIVLSFVKRSVKFIIYVNAELLKRSFHNSVLEVPAIKEVCKCPFCTSENRCSLYEKRKCVRRMGTKRKMMKKNLQSNYINVSFLQKLDLM